MQNKNNRISAKSVFGFLLVIAITLSLLGSCTAASSEMIAPPPPEESPEEPPEGSIEKPTWNIGDSWSMGYEIDLGEMSKEIESMYKMLGKVNKCDFQGEMAVYQSAIVQDDDMVITIDNTQYTCYDIYFEQYVGAIYTADLDIEMDMSDLYDDDYDYEYEDDYRGTRATSMDFSTSSSSSSNTMDMVMTMYLKMKGDLTGHIFFTVDKLAVAKGTFVQTLVGEMEMNMKATMEGLGTMTMDTSFQFDNIYVESDVAYNPPLDIFDFPIEPDESWSASAEMTKTISKISGKISYEMSTEIPDYPSQPEKEVIDLSKEISTPDIYGPVSVTYYFDNSGTDTITLATGMNTECFIIESDDYYDDYFYDDDYDSYNSGKKAYEVESSSSLIPSPVDSGDLVASDFEADSMDTPVEVMAESTNYYSEDEDFIVSTEPPNDSSNLEYSSTPFSSSEEIRMTPRTYEDVSKFKTVGRENMLNSYSKPTDGKDDDRDSESTWTMIIIGITAIFVISLIVAMGIQVARKRKPVKAQTPSVQPPWSQAQPQPQATPQYSHPDPYYTRPQPQPQPYYQQQSQAQPQQQYQYPDYRQQSPYSSDYVQYPVTDYTLDMLETQTPTSRTTPTPTYEPNQPHRPPRPPYYNDYEYPRY